jgi:deoxyadenosine/deoxycytidine kinase
MKDIYNTLILVGGNIANGKTTLCKELSNYFNVPYVEINNIDNIYDCMVFESIGLGYRTTAIAEKYSNVIRVKCEVGKNQTYINIDDRKKVFNDNENRLGLTEYEFYNKMKSSMYQYKHDISYDYRKDNIDKIINFIKGRGACHPWSNLP